MFTRCRRVLSILMSAALVLSLTLGVPLSANAAEAETFEIKIVHTNDIHARVQEDASSGIIGVERLKTIIDSYTAGADMDLVLDSGDLFHGQSIATLVQGESIARLVKACGYDAMTAGNHDWSYGKDRLAELADIAELTMLTGNVVSDDGSLFMGASGYVEGVEKNGQTIEVGVFGVIDPSLYKSTAPANVEGLTFTDPVEYARKAAADLRDWGCDIVIALSHTYDPAELAASVDGVDVWLAGHEHMDIDTTVTTPNGSTAYVFENGYYLYMAGLIDLECDVDANGDVTAIRCEKTSYFYDDAAKYEKNAEVSALLSDIIAEQSVILDEVIGTSSADLDGVWEHLRIGETNLGKAVASAYLLETGADVAFENAGGIRASIAAGDVTYGDVISVSPYGNYIITKQITGKELAQILEISIEIQLQSIAANDSGDYDAWPQGSGSYLQTAGVTVEYNPTLENGSRIISVLVGGEKLDENKLYTIATNNYVASSSYYTQLANAPATGEFSSCDEALIKFFKQNVDVIDKAVSAVGMIAVDKTAPEEPAGSTPSAAGNGSSNPSVTPSKEYQPAPKTGDSARPVACIVVLAVSGAAVLLLSGKRKNAGIK